MKKWIQKLRSKKAEAVVKVNGKQIRARVWDCARDLADHDDEAIRKALEGYRAPAQEIIRLSARLHAAACDLLDGLEAMPDTPAKVCGPIAAETSSAAYAESFRRLAAIREGR
jgi:hypothetical protein